MPGRFEHSAHFVRIVPNQALGRHGLLSGSLSLLPIFVVLLWMTRLTTSWPAVVVAGVVITAAATALYIRFRMVQATITDSEFVKQGLRRVPTRVDRGRIERVVLARVYRSHSAESLTHLLALGPDGERLFRLNGLFWPEAALQTVADALGAQTSWESMPVSRRDFHSAYPMARRWYERNLVAGGHPWPSPSSSAVCS